MVSWIKLGSISPPTLPLKPKVLINSTTVDVVFSPYIFGFEITCILAPSNSLREGAAPSKFSMVSNPIS